MSSILRKVVEDLGVLGDSTRSLSKSQELVQLPVHEAFRDVVCSESRAKLSPSDHMIVLQQRHVVLPPELGWSPKLLCSKLGLVSLKTVVYQQCKLGLDQVKPSVRVQRVINPCKKRRLGP